MDERIKVGDRVRQVRTYYPEQHMYIGRVGTVTEIRYNPNMAVYGKGEEILVRWDGQRSNWIEYEYVLEVIK